MNRQSNASPERSIPEMEICLYRKSFARMQMCLVAMDCNVHISFMHNWANQWYATKYWQMQSEYPSFLTHYQDKMKSLWEQVVIVYLDKHPIAQIEIYLAQKAPISTFIQATKNDFGFHLLMAPYRDLIQHFGKTTKGLSQEVIHCLLEYLFYNCKANRVFAEPDIQNVAACHLAESSGLTYLKDIELPDKTAKLYSYEYQDFIQKYPMPKHIHHLNLFADKKL